MLEADGVLVVGDSIAQATVHELAVRLDTTHGLPVAVNTHPGRPTAPAVDWIVEHADLIPERGIVVVNGADDVFAPLDWWRQVERVLAAADGRPVYWLTVHVDRWSGDAERRQADRHNSDWINDRLADGVHPSTAGTVAWCDLLERAMGFTGRG